MDELQVYFDTNDLQGAQKYIDALPQDNAHTQFLLGKLKSRQGDMSGALSCYHKAINLDANCLEARTMIEMSNKIYDFRDPNLLNP